MVPPLIPLLRTLPEFMARDASDATPMKSRDQLVAAIAAGGKPPGEWRIGTVPEREKFGFHTPRQQPGPL